jgi:hypothetical protein
VWITEPARARDILISDQVDHDSYFFLAIVLSVVRAELMDNIALYRQVCRVQVVGSEFVPVFFVKDHLFLPKKLTLNEYVCHMWYTEDPSQRDNVRHLKHFYPISETKEGSRIFKLKKHGS